MTTNTVSQGAPATPAHGVTVGTPATIRLYTDTSAGVVTKVSAKSITVSRVETGPTSLDMASDSGAYGIRPTLADGLTDRPIDGSGQRFTWQRGAWRNGSISVALGHSISRVDYRF